MTSDITWFNGNRYYNEAYFDALKAGKLSATEINSLLYAIPNLQKSKSDLVILSLDVPHERHIIPELDAKIPSTSNERPHLWETSLYLLREVIRQEAAINYTTPVLIFDDFTTGIREQDRELKPVFADAGATKYIHNRETQPWDLVILVDRMLKSPR